MRARTSRAWRWGWLAAALPVVVGPVDAGEDSALHVVAAESGRVAVGPLDASLVSGLAARPPDQERWRAGCRVSVEGAETPILGRAKLAGSNLVFEPRFPFVAGTTYRVELVPGRLIDGLEGPPRRATFQIAGSSHVWPTVATAIHPSGEELPENLLRFYIQFSGPMSRGDAYRYVRLVDERGEPVERAFLILGEELWDPEHRRFTLLLDPGRIKRGLVPHQELGPILVAGRRYTLEVDAGWPDANGRPLGWPLAHGFQAGPEDTTPPDPASWELTTPVAGSWEALKVRFPEPLDHALIQRLIVVVDDRGRRVAGRGKSGPDDRSWTFRPDAPWLAGAYELEVDTDLEDRAGNRVGQRFEVDVFDEVESRVIARSARRGFKVD